MNLNNDSVVVVTGASRGIGKETAIEFARKGCKVALLSRDSNLLLGTEAEIQKLGVETLAIVCDVSVEKQCFAAVEQVTSKWNGIDVLVNNAGYGHYSSIENLSTSALDEILKTNLFGSFWLIKAVLPIMKAKKRGHIVNVSTIISKRAMPYMGAYCISKFAMTGMDESLRPEVKPYGIDVTLVCPGYTATEFQKNAKLTGLKPKLQRSGAMMPHEVARTIVTAVEKRQKRVILTFSGKLLLLANKIWPEFVDFFLFRYFRPDTIGPNDQTS